MNKYRKIVAFKPKICAVAADAAIELERTIDMTRDVVGAISLT